MQHQYRLPALPTTVDLAGGTVVDINNLIMRIARKVQPLTLCLIAVMLQPLIRIWKENKLIKIKGTSPQSEYVSELIEPSSERFGRTVETLLSVKMMRVGLREDEGTIASPPLLELRQLLWPLGRLTPTQIISAFAYYKRTHGDHLQSAYLATYQSDEAGVDAAGQPRALPFEVDVANNEVEVRK